MIDITKISCGLCDRGSAFRIDGAQNLYDEVYACIDHVGHLLGSPMTGEWNVEWTVSLLDQAEPPKPTFPAQLPAGLEPVE